MHGVHAPHFNIDETAIEIGMGIMAWSGERCINATLISQTVSTKKILPMRFYFFCTIILLLFVFSTCKKNQVETQYPFVPLNACVEKTLNAPKVEICFNKLVEDSRCPINAVCIWAGVAKANFTFKVSSQEHTFDLATNEIKPRLHKRHYNTWL